MRLPKRIATAGGTPAIARASTGVGGGGRPPVSLQPGATAPPQGRPRGRGRGGGRRGYWKYAVSCQTATYGARATAGAGAATLAADRHGRRQDGVRVRVSCSL